MPRPKRWLESAVKDGFVTYTLSDHKYFFDFIHHEMLDYKTYTYRGQRRSDWKLVSSLDRLTLDEEERQEHLDDFIQATRGRRGPNPPEMNGPNDWWALGQHHGLATPLLDWTTSPFVAAYFAFCEADPKHEDKSEFRAVWALAQYSVHDKADAVKDDSVIALVNPISDENPRLVNQAALFTYLPTGVDVESWVRKHFKEKTDGMVLIKIEIPNKDRETCLRDLNRMNINHLTLFPDLFGASVFCNLKTSITSY